VVRLTADEKERLEYYAEAMQVSMSEVIQDYCKSLPRPPKLSKSKDSLPLN
jgi:hypothetical protein